jgi:hypothetical protein
MNIPENNSHHEETIISRETLLVGASIGSAAVALTAGGAEIVDRLWRANESFMPDKLAGYLFTGGTFVAGALAVRLFNRG